MGDNHHDDARNGMQEVVNFKRESAELQHKFERIKLNFLTIEDACFRVILYAKSLDEDLDDLSSSWHAIRPDLNDEAVSARMDDFHINLHTTAQSVGGLRNKVNFLHGKTNDLINNVQSKQTEFQHKLDADKIEEKTISHALARARLKLKEDKQALEGGSGFGLGFATGVTFGLYNPVQDNYDDQVDQVNAIGRQKYLLQKNIEDTNRHLAMLNPLTSTLARIGLLDQAVVKLENDVNQLTATAQKAQIDYSREHRAEHSEHKVRVAHQDIYNHVTVEYLTDAEASEQGIISMAVPPSPADIMNVLSQPIKKSHRGRAAKYYKRKLEADMKIMLGWIGVFPSYDLKTHLEHSQFKAKQNMIKQMKKLGIDPSTLRMPDGSRFY